MTSYHGGKQRIGKEIAQIIYNESMDIEDEYDFAIKGYCEPFCGMLGVYQHIPDLFENHKPKLKYKAGDFNKSVVMMWQSAQKGWKPPTKRINKLEFMSMAGDGKSSAEKGYIGHLYGYMGKYFKPFDNRITQSNLDNTSDKVSRIALDLSNVNFSYGSYLQYSKLKNYIIYCDPPYQVQSNYYDESDNKRSFDHNRFWNWCKKMSDDNIVFVSEYKTSTDFVKVWGKGKENLYIM